MPRSPSADESRASTVPTWTRLLLLLPLLLLWFTLINQLRVEWTLNPQYNYGWSVPFLCIWLFWRRLNGQRAEGKVQGAGNRGQKSEVSASVGGEQRASESGEAAGSGQRAASDEGGASDVGGRRPEIRSQYFRGQRAEDSASGGREWEAGDRVSVFPFSILYSSRLAFCFLLFVFAFLWLPIRLVQEANPEWRLVSWGLAIVAVGITLCLSLRAGGMHLLRCAATPALFFLVAVPWPTVFEAPVIRTLTRLNAVGAVEVLTWLGIPALRQGNVIEISTGLVGIEDACSGIRSIQACLMIGLFLGAYYRLKHVSRLGLVLAGVVMAMAFNLARTVLLVAVASRQGIQAVESWHDPAGVSILVGCFLGVWALAAYLHRCEAAKTKKATKQPVSSASRTSNGAFIQPVTLVSIGLVSWLLAAEVGVEMWYRQHEGKLSQRAIWRVQLPEHLPGYERLLFTETAVRFLRFDEGLNAAWRDDDGNRCQAIFLRWDPGRIAVHLARSHTPEVCLTAAGRKLTGAPETQSFSVDGLTLPFDVYYSAEENLWVYYCLWEDRVPGEDSATEQLSYHNRFTQVIEGRRNLGQRSLEFAIWSDASPEVVRQAVERDLRSIIRVQATPSPR